MKNKVIINDINETMAFSTNFAKKLIPNDIVCLSGDLGTGKTVISKSICKFFKVSDEVISPTFNILKIYKTSDLKIKQILHFDLYRLNSESDLINLGFLDYLDYNDSIIIIEWPDYAKDLLNRQYYDINISTDPFNINKRVIIYEKKD